MRMKFRMLAVLVAALCLAAGLGAQARGEHWVGTWATADTWRPAIQPSAAGAPPLVPQITAPPAPAGGAGRAATPPRPIQFNNQTLRQIVHVSIGGSRVRVVLSNAFGTAPITIGAASLAVRDKDAAIVVGTSRPLTFSGQASTTLPTGAVMVTDAVDLAVAPLSDLAIDLFLSGDTEAWTSPLTYHSGAYQTNYVSAPGNHSGEAQLSEPTATTAWFLLSRVEVMAPASSSAIVAIGDSITDGTRSTANTNSRWPDELARRLQAQASTRGLSVLNAGIAGNRVLSEGAPTAGINILARFDRDALAQSGVAYIVVMEAINDIGAGRNGPSPSADELIAAHRQLVERAHVKGIKIFGATLTPFEGAAYFTAEGETKRQAVNAWIRTSKTYDGVIDFDQVIRDPANPTRFRADYNSGDSLHPNDAGYKAMGDAVDLGLFK